MQDQGPWHNKYMPHCLITRALNDAHDFLEPLQAQGYNVAGIPCITCHPVRFQISKTPPTVAVFTSRWGVIHFFEQGGSLPNDCHIGVVGENTAQVLATYGIRPDFLSLDGTSQGLASYLLATASSPQHVLWPCGSQALTEWTHALFDSGWTMDSAAVYTTQQRTTFTEQEQSDLLHAQVLAITSPSCVEAINTWLNREKISLPPSITLLAIGPTTQQAIAHTWQRDSLLATPRTLSGLAQKALATLT